MKAVIFFTYFSSSFGGSEYLPLLMIAALQKEYQVTLALNWASDVRLAAETYNIPIDFDNLEIVTLKSKSKLLQRLDSVLPVLSLRRLQRIAKDADLCISCANMVDFGPRAAFHFVYLLNQFGDNAFIDYVRHVPPLKGMAAIKRYLRTFLAEALVRPLTGVRSSRKLLKDSRQHFYPASQYVHKIMRAFYGDFNGRVFYPPTIFEIDATAEAVERDPFRIVYIGRLTAQKGIRELVEIVEIARERSGIEFTLELAGCRFETTYVDDLVSYIAAHPFVRFVGEKYGMEKQKFLCGGTFALHACREEAFGISIVEYLKAGVLPLVPDEGGSPEIVANRDLIWHDTSDAVGKLILLASDAAMRKRLLVHCRERAAVFSRAAYMQNQAQVLNEIIQCAKP